MRGTVIIFVKAPRAGKVKTRLGAEIGAARAAALFRIMTVRTIAEAEASRRRVMLAVDPPSAMNGLDNLWPARFERIAQGCGNLGDRMKRVIIAAPAGPAVVIGADAPSMRARHLRTAFHALDRHDAVFGPAADGGYWLIGLAQRRAAPGLFDDVRWSTPNALADTLASLPENFDADRINMLHDVDEAKDLRHFGARSTASLT